MYVDTYWGLKSDINIKVLNDQDKHSGTVCEPQRHHNSKRKAIQNEKRKAHLTKLFDSFNPPILYLEIGPKAMFD